MAIPGLILGAALVALLAGPAAAQDAPRVDRSKPPIVSDTAGGFTVRRLGGPIAIDGRTWIPTQTVSGAGTIRAPNGQFTLTLSEATSAELVHYRISFSELGRAPLVLDPGQAVYAYITPDSRWIFSSTLEVIDVRDWRKYSLSRAFKIDPWVVLRARSADGRRLFVSRQPCPFDCQHLPNEYYEIGFPERQATAGRTPAGVRLVSEDDPSTQGKRLVVVDDGKELGSIDVPPRVPADAVAEGLKAILRHPNGVDLAVGFRGDKRSFVVVFLRQASGSYLAVDVSQVERANIGFIGPARSYRDVHTVPIEWLPDKGDDAVQIRLQTRARDMTGRRYRPTEPLIITRDGKALWR